MTVLNHSYGRQGEQGDERKLVPHAWRNHDHHHHYRNKTVIPAAAHGRRILCIVLVWVCCSVNASMVLAAASTTDAAHVIQLTRMATLQSLLNREHREHQQLSDHRGGTGGGDDAAAAARRRRHLLVVESGGKGGEGKGDYDSINAMLQGQSMDIPLGPTPPEISQSGFTLKIKSLSCFGVSMGHMDLLWNQENNNNKNNGNSTNELDLDLDLEYFSTQSNIGAMVDLVDLSVSCQGTFDYHYMFGNGTGVVNIETTNNDAQIGLVLATTTPREEKGTVAASTRTEAARTRALQEEVAFAHDSKIKNNNNNNAALLDSDSPSMVPSPAPFSRTDVGPDDKNAIVQSHAVVQEESDNPPMAPSSITSATAGDKKGDSTVEKNTAALRSDVPSMVPTMADDHSIETSRDQIGVGSGQDDDNNNNKTAAIPPTFSQTPPTVLKMSSCNVVINVTTLEFDLQGEGAEYLQNLLVSFDTSGFITTTMGTLLCDFLRSASNETEVQQAPAADNSTTDDDKANVNNFLASIAAHLEPYLSAVSPEPRDPLVVEAALELPSNLKAMDFLHPTTALSHMASQAVNGLSSVSFNRLMADFLLNENGEIHLDIAFLLKESYMSAWLDNHDINATTRDVEIPSSRMVTPFGELVIEAKDIFISGLNSLRDANTSELISLSVVGSHSLQVEHVLQDANIRMAVSVELLPLTSGGNLVMSFPPQTVMIEVPVEELVVSATMLLILDEDKVEQVPMASFTDANTLVECLASAIYTAEILALEMSSPLAIGLPLVSGLEHLSPGLSRVGETFLNMVFGSFGPSLSYAIPRMFETTLVVKMNALLDDAVTYNGTCTDLAPLPASPPYDALAAESVLDLPPELQSINFEYPTTRISLLLSQGLSGLSVNKVIADHLLDENGEIKVDLSGIDFTSLMGEDFMKSENAVVFEDGTLGLATAVGNMALNVEEAAITGLKSIESMPEVLMVSAVGQHHLKVQMALETIQLRVSAKVKLTPLMASNFSAVVDKYLPQMITFNVPINHLAFAATMLLVVDENKIAELPKGGLLRSDNYNIVDCMITTIYMAKLGELEIFSPLSFGVPVMSGIDTFSPELSKAGKSLVNILTSSEIILSPPIVRMLEVTLAKSINSAINDTIASSTGTCEESTVVAQDMLYDPYAVEAALEIPPQAINFTNPTTPFSTWFTDLLTGIAFNKLVVGSLLDENGEIQFDVGSVLNRSDCLALLIDSFMGAESTRSLDGSIAMTTSHGNLNIHFEEIAVSGLDSLSDANAAEIISVAPASPHHLKLDLKLENAKIRVAGKVTLLPLMTESGTTDMSFPPQTLMLEYPIDSLTATVMLLLVLDEKEILDMTVASMTNKTSLVGCLRTLVHMAEFVGWKMLSPYEIGPPRLTGLDPEFIHFGGTLVKSLLSAFDPSSSGTMLESSVSQFVQCAMSSSSGLCTKPDLDELEDDVMIDFREVFLPPDQASAYGFEAPAGSGMMGAGAGVKVKTFLDSSGILGGLLALGAADGGGGGSGSINKEGALVSADVRIPLGKTDTRIKLEIKQLRIENADSIEDLSLFNPVPMQAHIVNNSVTMGTPQKPLRIAASVLFGVSSGNKVIRNEMQIQLDLAESQLITEVMLRISQKKLLSLSVKDMMEKSSDCLLSSLLDVPVLDEYGVRISNSQLSFSFRNVDFIMGEGIRNMTCVNCESHEFQTMSHLLQQPNEQEDAGQQFEKMINSIVSTLIEGDASYVQNKIDQYLVNASKHCAVTNAVVSEPVPITGFQDFQSPPEDSALDYILVMLIVMLAIMLFTLCICVFVRWVVTRRHRKWLRTLSRAQILSAYQAQSRQKEKEAALSALSKSMFQSKEVNTFAKYFIPFTVLGNIALFLSGHLSPGGSIRAYMGLAGQHIVMDDVYNFSIAQSALDLWNSDGKVLSTVMFLFSMIWPYLKQVVTMVVWFLPTTLLSLQQRRKILHDLDRLAKWSMVDVFVMIFMLVSFRVSFSSPGRTYLPSAIYTVDMMVAPLFGMYANMTAQLVSQISSHFILQFQRRIEAAANKKYMSMTSTETNDSMEIEDFIIAEDRFDDQVENGDSEEENRSSERNSTRHHVTNNGSSVDADNDAALCQNVFYRFHRQGTDGLVPQRGVNIVIIFGATAIVALVAAGCAIPSFGTDALGVVGVLVGLGRGDGSSSSNHSIFSVSKLIVDMAEFLTSTKELIGLLSIAVLLVATTLVIPMAVVVAQLVRWFYSLKNQASRDRLDIWIEILEAWQYIEVYVLTILLGIWQLGDVSEHMMNKYCGNLSATFAKMAHFDILAEEDAQCFKLQPSVQAGSYILMLAAIVLSVLRTWMTLAIRQVKLQQEQKLQQPTSSSSMMPVGSLDVDADSVKRDVSVLIKEISPAPVLLTDRFRWVMVKA